MGGVRTSAPMGDTCFCEKALNPSMGGQRKENKRVGRSAKFQIEV